MSLFDNHKYENVEFIAQEDVDVVNYASAIYPYKFEKGRSYRIEYLQTHNLCDEEPLTEENTMSGWVIMALEKSVANEKYNGCKQSTKQLDAFFASDKFRRIQ